MKLFENLEKIYSPAGIMLLQEKHSSEKDEIRWTDEFKGSMFSSHVITSSCGAAVGFF